MYLIIVYYINLIRDSLICNYEQRRMQLWRVNETAFNFRVSNKQFVRLDDQGGEIKLVADSDSSGNMETFLILRNDDDPNRIRIRAPNGLFLQVLLNVNWSPISQ